ncbi:MAG: helicase-related protein [Actinomycetota bacterium]|nr:helicase-related protein [Nitrospiraceae bacterium]MDA8157194.1 helicase-related protein [Actinomycetota bacterium]
MQKNPSVKAFSSTDLTFFTNEPGATLLDRFRQTLKYVRLFDILVGYFRTSGFFHLYDSFETIEKIRILVGINVDKTAFEIIEASKNQKKLDFESHKQTKDIFSNNLATEMEHSEDTYDTEIGIRKFMEFLRSGKLEIKAYPSSKIHAKVYISRFQEDALDYGRVITGSSNFSDSGLVENLEFNVELKNSADVKYALDKFEALWKDAVDVSKEYVDTINVKTWLNDQITPYMLYLKFLYEYFKEDINMDEDITSYLPEGFMELKYQKQAVVSARKILDAYNGVFLSDVVGLGKTFISALLAQQLPGKILVICPPVLQEYWQEVFFEFGIRGFKIESLGKLDDILRAGTDKFDYVFVDEAHRFRNELTQGYEKLHEICFGKKVILVSATPLNNTIDDIYSQIKLFQVPKKSTIPGISDLEKFFGGLKKKLNKFDRTDPQYLATLKTISREIRDKLLKYVMVRRTRTEVNKYFGDDIQKQGLSFPEVDDPKRIIYTFDNKIEKVFNETMSLLKGFSYTRYTPLLYLKTPVSEFEQQSQRNIGGFMKGILVKRLESSFYAFNNTLRRFIESYEKFIAMYEKGTVYIGKKVNVYDFLDTDNEEELLRLVEGGKVQKYDVTEFRGDFLTGLKKDLALLSEIGSLWKDIVSDPKLNKFIDDLGEKGPLKDGKLIVFTESKETGEYLYKNLEKAFPSTVFFFSSAGGVYENVEVSTPVARDMIKENFDPASKHKKDTIRLLITTDILAEGINLHRSNTVINYDLPWNPMRVLQRVGRVNRVGSEHEQIHIFNFFPTSQSDEHLGLEASIKSKIQAFHDTLGEDAKYLTEEEVISTHELFGDNLYKRLSEKRTFQGEDEEERSELEYLQILRDVRDKNSPLFEQIKRLPKKARTCRKNDEVKQDCLITFFRKGKLKKFFRASGPESKELTFFEAVDLFRCLESARKLQTPKEFYPLLDQNKAMFDLAVSGETAEIVNSKGSSNEAYVIKRLKAKEMKLFPGFTEDDEDFLQSLLRAFENGIMPKNTSKRIKKEIEKEVNPLKVLAILKKNINLSILDTGTVGQGGIQDRREVILSEYLTVAEKS